MRDSESNSILDTIQKLTKWGFTKPLILAGLIFVSFQGYGQKPDCYSGLKTVPGMVFENNLLYLAVPVDGGDTLFFFTDTGGGRVAFADVAEKLELPVDSIFAEGRWMELINLNPEFHKRELPEFVISEAAGIQFTNMLFRGDNPFGGKNYSMLGAWWFADKVWRFDYIGQQVFTAKSVDWGCFSSEHLVEASFQKDDHGNLTTHFPRIPVVVDGDTLQVLFDTGATIRTRDQDYNNEGELSSIAGGFIVERIFNQWKARNPDWDVIPGGDVPMGADVIIVPEITIAGHTVGPVLFASRKNENFDQWMSQWMDKPIVGAIGGSVFQYFSNISLDYREGKVYFER